MSAAPMRAVLVTHSNGGGGAGRATQRLFQALDGIGMDVAMLADWRHGSDPRVRTTRGPLTAARRRLRISLEELPAFLARDPRRRLFSPGLTSAFTAHRVERLMPGVVNLHWTGYGCMSIHQIGRLAAPVVWTLHDMWPMTGGLGYDDVAGGGSTALERWVLHRKERSWWRPMSLVAPSAWLAGVARRSPITASWPAHVIPNPIDVTAFAPGSREASRERLGLDPGALIVAFAAGAAISDPRKGADLLAGAIGAASARLRRPVQLVVLGGEHGHHGPALPPGTRWLGQLDGPRLVDAYRSADLTVVPSRQDNLPQAATESVACGVPVVAFAVGGLPDVIGLGEEACGALVPTGDEVALGQAIADLLADPQGRARMGAHGRRRALRLWAPEPVARAYAAVFDEAVERERVRRSAGE